jgi:exonuclease SbcC
MRSIVFKQFSIKNFLSIGDEPIQLQFNKGIHLITGENKDKDGRRNGVGKSALMDAFHWTLFGSPIRDINKSTVANFNTKGKCEGILEFDVNVNGKNNSYKIIRTLTPSKCFLYVNNEDKTLSTINNTNDLVQNVLGFDSPLFCNSVVLSINSTKSFFAQDKIAKRKFIEGIFRLEVFSTILADVRQKSIDIKKQIDILDTKIDNKKQNANIYEGQKKVFEEERERKLKELNKDVLINETKKVDLSGKLIDAQSLLDKQTFLKNKKKQIDDTINQKELEIKDLNETSQKAQSLIEKYERCDSELKDLIKSKGLIEKRKEDLKLDNDGLIKLKQKIEDKKAVKITLQGEISKLTKFKETKREFIWSLKQNASSVEKDKQLYVESTKVSFCPTCKKPLDVKLVLDEAKVAEFDSKIGELNNSILHNEKEIKDQIDTEIEKHELGLKNYDEEVSKVLNAISSIEKIQLEYDLLQKQLNEINHKVLNNHGKNDYNDLIKGLETEKKIFNDKILKLDEIKTKLQVDGISKIDEELNKLDVIINQNEKIKYEIGFVDKQILDYKKQINETSDQKNTFIELLDNNTKEYNILVEEQKNNQKLFTIYESAKFIVSEEGVKSYIIKKLLSLLNNRIDYYLKKLDSNSTCCFDEFFDETIKNDKGIVCSYFNFSGAEMKTIDLACLFAFMDLRRLQGDVSINVSMYDELFDSSFDEKGIEHITEILLERVMVNQEAIFIISHRKESLKAITGELVYLEKSNGITRRVFNN